MKKALCGFLVLLFLLTSLVPVALADDEPVSDPSGATIGTAADVVGVTAGGPTKEDMETLAPKEPLAAKSADVVGHKPHRHQHGLDVVCGLPGHVHAGRIRPGRNRIHPRQKPGPLPCHEQCVVYGIGMLGYWICGFALQMGGRGRR
jgi:Amt family ammonium transporter